MNARKVAQKVDLSMIDEAEVYVSHEEAGPMGQDISAAERKAKAALGGEWRYLGEFCDWSLPEGVLNGTILTVHRVRP